MKKIIRLSSLAILFSILVISCAIAQGNSKPVTTKYKRLSVGDKLPEMAFKNLSNYPKKQAVTSDFKGKLMILDFWSTGCSSCIAAFPKMEKLQKEFDGKLQVVLVNPWESKEQIAKTEDRWKKYYSDPNYKLKMPAVPAINGDSTWLTLFPMNSVPTHVWVNDKGTIIAITNGYNATPEHVQAVLDGKKVDMLPKDDMAYKENSELIRKSGWLSPTLPSMPPVYYSAFIPYFPAGGAYTAVDSAKGIFRSEITRNSGPIELFRTAFRDNKNSSHERWLLEMKNPEQYQSPRDNNLLDNWLKKYCFTYEIQGPLKDKNNWQPIMQQDVNRFMGSMFGLEGKMEKRKFNALVLVKTKEGLLKTLTSEQLGQEVKSGVRSGWGWNIKYTDSVYTHDGPAEYLLSMFTDYMRLENVQAGRVVLDETGIDKKTWIDLTIKGDLRKMTVEEVRKQLQQYGLDIIEAERELEILVVKDKE